jgi:hypothetical protein
VLRKGVNPKTLNPERGPCSLKGTPLRTSLGTDPFLLSYSLISSTRNLKGGPCSLKGTPLRTSLGTDPFLLSYSLISSTRNQSSEEPLSAFLKH